MRRLASVYRIYETGLWDLTGERYEIQAELCRHWSIFNFIN